MSDILAKCRNFVLLEKVFFDIKILDGYTCPLRCNIIYDTKILKKSRVPVDTIAVELLLR